MSGGAGRPAAPCGRGVAAAALRPCPPHSFPHATSQTLLAKFKQQHEDNRYFLGTPVLEPAFIIQHFAGRVKYQIKVHARVGTAGWGLPGGP